mmetsp:Transcript_41452/g.130551  ORF Transcript_41452/g.130551 Transcript_41452/m.130551 type:complete len:180 (+) Transcript_41452:712-1251(+)
MDGLKILEDDIRSGSFTRSSTITIEVAYFAQSSPVGKAVDVDQQELFAEHVEQIRGAVEIALKGWDVQVIVNDGKEAGSEGSSRKLDAGCFELWLKWQCPVLRSVLLYRRGNSSDAMPDIFTLFSEILQVLETPLEECAEQPDEGEERKEKGKEKEADKAEDNEGGNVNADGELKSQDL